MRGERSAIQALYAAKMEATRRSVLPRDRMAAIRALIEERRAHMRALTERRQLIVRLSQETNAAKKGEIERSRERQSQRSEPRDEARPT